MPTKTEYKAWLLDAKKRTDGIVAMDPSWGPAASVQKQLQHLLALAQDGTGIADPNDSSITVGLIAVREFEGVDDALARLLKDIDYWCRRYDQMS